MPGGWRPGVNRVLGAHRYGPASAQSSPRTQVPRWGPERRLSVDLVPRDGHVVTVGVEEYRGVRSDERTAAGSADAVPADLLPARRVPSRHDDNGRPRGESGLQLVSPGSYRGANEHRPARGSDPPPPSAARLLVCPETCLRHCARELSGLREEKRSSTWAGVAISTRTQGSHSRTIDDEAERPRSRHCPVDPLQGPQRLLGLGGIAERGPPSPGRSRFEPAPWFEGARAFRARSIPAIAEPSAAVFPT
jgi:hypothetical protein